MNPCFKPILSDHQTVSVAISAELQHKRYLILVYIKIFFKITRLSQRQIVGACFLHSPLFMQEFM